MNLKTGVSRKQSKPNFAKNEHFLPPDTLRCVSEGKKCSFFRKFGWLIFLETPVLRFALLPCYRQNIHCYLNTFLKLYLRVPLANLFMDKLTLSTITESWNSGSLFIGRYDKKPELGVSCNISLSMKIGLLRL